MCQIIDNQFQDDVIIIVNEFHFHQPEEKPPKESIEKKSNPWIKRLGSFFKQIGKLILDFVGKILSTKIFDYLIFYYSNR